MSVPYFDEAGSERATVMANLCSLPEETILGILSFLHPSQVERVAKTFNKNLYRLCIDLIQPLLQARRDEKHMSLLFKAYNQSYDSQTCDYITRQYGLQHFREPSFPSRHLDYLGLNEDLRWLSKFAEADDDIKTHTNPRVMPAEVDKLMHAAVALGLRIPGSFQKLLRDHNLADCVKFDDPSLALGPLCKIWNTRPSKKAVDDDNETDAGSNTDTHSLVTGYVVMFCMDSDFDLAMKFLYLDTQGRHAVLDGENLGKTGSYASYHSDNADTPPSSALEKSLGVRSMDAEPKDFYLEDLTFEGWLVAWYFESRRDLWYGVVGTENSPEKPEPCALWRKHEHDYLVNVCTEKGRDMQ